MKLSKNLHWAIYILFVFSCAKQSAPTGGPKDTIPPKLVQAFPPDESINFGGKEIELEFNEMVSVDNPKEQLIITPSIGKDFEVKTRKNSVIVSLEKSLEENTTYTFNFREAIQDVTERNKASNLTYAISTGPYLDSLKIEGTAYDLIKGKEMEDVTIALHVPVPNDTFNIFKHPATILTKTDKKGKFKIEHLKPQAYHIYAIEDKNRNLFADSRTESYGFLKDSIRLEKDTSSIPVPLVKLDTRPLKLTSARSYNTYFNLRASKNIKSFTLVNPDSADLYFAFGEDRANIKIYNTIEPGDSIKVHLTAFDSIGNKLDTAVFAKFAQREVIPEKFTSSISNSSILASPGLFTATFNFSKPVKEINFDSLFFQVDSLTKINFSKEDISVDEPNRIITLKKKLNPKLFEIKTNNEPGTKPPKPAIKDSTQNAKPIKILNSLYSGKGAFISIEQDSSKKTTQNIKPLQTEDLSAILFDIKTTRKDILLQLLDKNLNVVQEKYNVLQGQFDNLQPGEYIMRVIIDVNKNKVWDPGNFFKKEEPEPILYYKDEKNSTITNLKANWEFQMAPMLINY